MQNAGKSQHINMQMSGGSAEYHLTAEEQAQAEGTKSVAVAVRSGPLLATAFHPELTDDVRWCAVSTRIVLRNFDSVPCNHLRHSHPAPSICLRSGRSCILRLQIM